MNHVLIPTKNWFVVGFIALVLVSLVFVPAVSASKPTHEIGVEFAKGNIGVWNELYYTGYAIQDADGKIVRNYYDYVNYRMWWGPSWTKNEYDTMKIDLSKTGLKFDKPFQKVLLRYYQLMIYQIYLQTLIHMQYTIMRMILA